MGRWNCVGESTYVVDLFTKLFQREREAAARVSERVLDHDRDGEQPIVDNDEELHAQECADGVRLVQEGGAVVCVVCG